MGSLEAMPNGAELIVGIVGAVGVNTDLIVEGLTSAFSDVGYKTRVIRLIEKILAYRPWSKMNQPALLDQRYAFRMTVGNEFRRKLDRNDAFALHAIASIRAERQREHENVERPIERCAFLLRSLKTPKEVSALRSVYGPNCLIVAGYSPRSVREDNLASRIATSSGSADRERHRGPAIDLIHRDARELGEDFGQNVRDTFALADVFIDVSNATEARRNLQRFVDLVFGHPFLTPSKAECAMFHAYGAAMRSSSAGRQVGAAIVDADGETLALATNEVARPFGGQYWADDPNDARDHTLQNDPALEMTHGILGDLLARLAKKEWLRDGLQQTAPEERLKQAIAELLPAMATTQNDLPSLSETARLTHIIEFIRAVHAEQAALMSAARRGVSVKDATLYSTAFPCHECAKLIVAAGVRRVVFIESYPKSRVAELFSDSIAVDNPEQTKVSFTPFVGVAPRRFLDLFVAPERRNRDGTWLRWNEMKKEQKPRQALPVVAYLQSEEERVDVFNQELQAKGITIE
jgi:cytidine deaminase